MTDKGSGICTPHIRSDASFFRHSAFCSLLMAFSSTKRFEHHRKSCRLARVLFIVKLTVLPNFEGTVLMKGTLLMYTQSSQRRRCSHMAKISMLKHSEIRGVQSLRKSARLVGHASFDNIQKRDKKF